ncbi:MAG: hypothetical protein M1815_001687 [Lichina confinis]|nr:MAG: hypothetical protein M1815_001687 [Lichina confinis]
MAELILGIVAVPGAVVAFVDYGKIILKTVDSFKNAPAVIQPVRHFGLKLSEGKLKLSLELARRAYSSPDVDRGLKDALEDHTRKLRSLILEVDASLTKLFDKSGKVRRYYVSLIGERRLQLLVKSLRLWQSDFSNTILLLEMKQRGGPASVPGQIPTHKPVLVEQRYVTDVNTGAEIREVASILTRHLSTNTTSSGGDNYGILKCVGHRNEEHSEIIFELPDGYEKPRMLRDVIVADQGERYGGGHTLDDRLRLARQLSNSVLAVFRSGLVHKNIRTNTILMLTERPNTDKDGLDEGPGLGTPFLTSWTMLRTATGLTSGPGDGDYQNNLYRHPKRQGLQPEERYNVGHDIYSLGGFLLEISLWEPFFTAEGCHSNLFRKTAVDKGYLPADEVDPMSKLTSVWVATNVLRVLAEKEVPPRMGTAFSRLIVACLTCLEGGMGGVDCFKSNTSEAAVRFNQLVSQSFTIT